MVAPRKEKGLLYLYLAAFASVVTWLFVLYPMMASFMQKKNSRFSTRWHSGHVADGAIELSELPVRKLSSSAPVSKYPGAVIMTLAGGDTSARNLVALLQSLIDVNTTLPFVVLLARGGLGSAACMNQEWKKANNRSGISCGSADTIGKRL
jgi:hypothetical protein